MGFFDTLKNFGGSAKRFSADCADHEARRYEGYTRSGRVDNRRLTEHGREYCAQKAANLRVSADRLRGIDRSMTQDRSNSWEDD